MRSYGQYCALAKALDVIGDRWTLLLVRDLLLGPKRYKDLLSGLPGIGTNLLADRLKELEATGLIERTVLPPPAGSTVYQLTETGQALEPVMVSLGRWGARFLGAPKKTDVMLPRAYFVAMRGALQELPGIGPWTAEYVAAPTSSRRSRSVPARCSSGGRCSGD